MISINVLILEEISKKADGYYEKSKNFGELASTIFGDKKKSQIRNLENIAYSSSMISHIYDYIKIQTGKSNTNEDWRKDKFGEKLLNQLIELKDDAKVIKDNVKNHNREEATEELTRQIHLKLIREFIKQLGAHYNYSLVPKEEGR